MLFKKVKTVFRLENMLDSEAKQLSEYRIDKREEVIDMRYSCEAQTLDS